MRSEPQLENLTPQQRVLCDVMWAFDDAEQVTGFIKTLPPGQRQEAESLRQMIVLECLEPYVEHYADEAQDLIDRVSSR